MQNIKQYWTLINGSCKYMQWNQKQINYNNILKLFKQKYCVQVNILFYILVALIQLIFSSYILNRSQTKTFRYHTITACRFDLYLYLFLAFNLLWDDAYSRTPNIYFTSDLFRYEYQYSWCPFILALNQVK